MKRTIAPTLAAVSLVLAACSADANDATPPAATDPGTDPSATDPGATPSTDDVSTSDDGGSDDGGSDDVDDAPGSGAGTTGGPIGFAPAALQQFDECEAFLSYVHTEGAERVGAYGFGDNGWFGPVFAEDAGADMEGDDFGDAMEESASVEQAEPASAGETTSSATETDDGSGGSYSTTNVQVDGVDEPDIVKTDGERIIALSDDVLHYVDVADDATSGTKRGSLDLFDDTERNTTWAYGHEILLDGDRAFVIAQGEQQFFGPDVMIDDEGGATVTAPPTTESDTTIDAPADTEPLDTAPAAEPLDTEPVDAEESFATEPDPEPMPADPDLAPIQPHFAGPTTIVIEVDLSNPDQLSIVNTLDIEGRYISARAVGATVRIAVTSPPQDLGFLFPSNPDSTDAAIEFNRELVANSTLDDWIPTYTLTPTGGQATTGDLVSCENIHAPSEFAGFDMLSIVTLGLDEPLGPPTATSAVMASGDTVYASADRMYVSTNVWLPPTLDEQQRGIWEEEYETAIHRFSIAGDGPAQYEASGSIDGHLLNQFSMNDRDGTFYVATTVGAPWNTDGSESRIVAMQINGDRLETVGQIGGLGEGERIFSVRYVDDVAYVVTFRRVDPFYVIDLADPTNMAVLGELKIPGFSSYLHPITDTLVLGVGQDATDEGFTTGTKVSLFDVTDPGDPREIDVWTLPNAGSDAEFDHRAFLYWPETGTAVLPLTSWADQFSGGVVLNVSADGLTEVGRITHVEEGEESGITDCIVVDTSQFTEQDGELFWVAQEGQVQTCTAEQRGGATGFSCEPIPVDQLANWFGTGDVPIDLDGVDRLEFCWPDDIDWQRQIRRTIVIDGQLWSLSYDRLQANALNTLDRTAVVELAG